MADIQQSAGTMSRIVDNIERAVYGKRPTIELIVLAVVARGHILIEDVPGVGKTSLVSAFAKSVACQFRRIQFTPDVMPSDITGFSVFNEKTGEFEFRPGGILSNFVLADEINRASAKTQSALLEAMEERQVTVDSNTYMLPEPFVVFATQNSLEQYGTYPLPEAQLDRFLIKTSIGYPPFDEEMRVVKGVNASKDIQAVVSGNDLIKTSAVAEQVYVGEWATDYTAEIVRATRETPELRVGASPRGCIGLVNLARAYALYHGRDYVKPDDIKFLAPAVLNHRVMLSHEAKLMGRQPEDVLMSIIDGIEVPIGAVPEKGRASRRKARPRAKSQARS